MLKILEDLNMKKSIEKGTFMWSKTKKALLDRMAENVKPRVRYEFYMKKKSYFDRAFFIQVDGKRCFATIPNSAGIIWDFICEIYKSLNLPCGYCEETRKAEEMGRLLALKYTGQAGTDYVMRSIHLYLNVYSFEESISSENYFIYALALMDRRLGKRQLKKIYENIEREPEWIRRFILLRAEAERLCCSKRNLLEQRIPADKRNKSRRFPGH